VATIQIMIVSITACFVRESVIAMRSLGERALMSSHTAVHEAIEMYRKKAEGKLTGDINTFEGILKPKNQSLLIDDKDRLTKQPLVN